MFMIDILINKFLNSDRERERNENKQQQAGAELCQAQEKLGLAKPALATKKL